MRIEVSRNPFLFPKTTMTGSDANPCRMKTERMILASEGWHLTWRDRMKFLDSKCAPINPHRFFIAQPF